MADGALRIAGIAVAAATHERARFFVTLAVAGAGHRRVWVPAAAILVFHAQIADHATTTGGLTDLHTGGPIGRAQAAATVTAVVARHAVNARAVG
jgi:hypothetical protein